jgi:hypothetical protein
MDPGDAGNGGGTGTPGGGGVLFESNELLITWAFPANAPNPTSFTVVAFTGSDPLDTTKYLFPPVECLPTDRSYKCDIWPKTTLTDVHGAVRANYA